jgi:hypothetical protein
MLQKAGPFVLLTLCFLAGVCFSSPSHGAAHAGNAFGRPVYGKKHVNQTQTFYHGDGVEPSVIRYNVEHHDGVIHFRQERYGVKTAKCTEEKMVLKFTTPSALTRFSEMLNNGGEGKILAGGCLDADSLDITGVCSKVLRANARRDLDERSKTLIITVKPAKWDEVFVNANVYATLQPQFAAPQMHKKGNGATVGKRKLRSSRKKQDENCDETKPDCNTNVGKTMRLPKIQKNINGKELAEWGALSVTCQQCEVEFQPTISFGLEIKWFKLKQVKLLVNGDLNIDAVMKAFAQFSGNSHNEKQFAPFNIPEIKFFAGVLPINIKTFAPMKASYKADFNAKATVTAGMTGTVRVNGGLVFKDNKFDRIGSFTPSFKAVAPAANGEAVMNAELSVGCDLQLRVNNIISGHLNIVPSVSLSGSSEIGGTDIQLKSQVNGNLKITVGGELGVVIKNRNIGPHLTLADKELLNINQKLWTGSMNKNIAFDMDEDEDYDDYSEEEDVGARSFELKTYRVKDGSGLIVNVPEEQRASNRLGFPLRKSDPPQCCWCDNGGDGSGSCQTVEQCIKMDTYECTQVGKISGCEYVPGPTPLSPYPACL